MSFCAGSQAWTWCCTGFKPPSSSVSLLALLISQDLPKVFSHKEYEPGILGSHSFSSWLDQDYWCVGSREQYSVHFSRPENTWLSLAMLAWITQWRYCQAHAHCHCGIHWLQACVLLHTARIPSHEYPNYCGYINGCQNPLSFSMRTWD